MAARGVPALTPENHRVAVAMRLSGASYEKIAAVLDISKPTAIKWANLPIEQKGIRYLPSQSHGDAA